MLSLILRLVFVVGGALCLVGFVRGGLDILSDPEVRSDPFAVSVIILAGCVFFLFLFAFILAGRV